MLRLTDGRTSGLFGLFGGVVAVPGLLVAGAPFADDTYYPHAVVASGVLWLVVGWIASRRSTRSPMATWADFWNEYAVLAFGIALGAIGALIAATAVLGESLI